MSSERICPICKSRLFECQCRFGVSTYGLFDIEINKLVDTYSVKWKENDK